MNKNSWPNFDDSMNLCKNYVFAKKDFSSWEIIQNQYYKIKDRPVQNQRIPKILHQIWLGRSIPQHIFDRIKITQENLPTDWSYKLWTDADLNTFNDFNQFENFYKTPNLGQRSDLLRIYILWKYGGVYCDTDFILVNFFEELLDLDFFGGLVYDDVPNISNSVLGSSPGSFFINELRYLDAPIGWKDGMDIINSTGQGLITRKYFRYKEQLENTVILPNTFLYPYPNCPTNRILGNDYNNYIKNETYCCHLWECSWM